MPTFEIRYKKFSREETRRAWFHWFHVCCDGSEESVAVGLSDAVRQRWDLDNTGTEELEVRVAVRYLKEHLASITALTPHRILLTARERRGLGEGWTVKQVGQEAPYEWKKCKHRRTDEAGPVCAVAHDRDPMHGITTLAACERCGLPSTDILCDNLVYVKTVGVETDQTGLRKRSLVDAQCNIGSDEFGKPRRDAKLCVPGGRNCWVQTYKPEEPQPLIVPAAVQFSIGEAIDQVNAAFRSRYGQKLIVIEEARSIEDLAGDCPTDDSFQHKLQVLAGLIEGMQLSGLLTKQEAEGSQGTLDLLGRLAHRDFSDLPGEYVRKLRNINKLSAGYPRHAKVKNIERAHAELGLPYPVTDYAKAWSIVSETFIQTLRQVALHLD